MASELELKKIAEGREAEMFEWEDGTILRLLRNPDAGWLNDLQTAALRAAGSSGVRVPEVLGATAVNGRPGLIMERIEGVDYLTLIGRQPWQVFQAASVSGQLHAKLHGIVAPPSLEALKSRLKRHIESQTKLDESLARFALEALDRLPDGDRLCHGDFHPGNILRTREGPVLIDWTNATRADPNADVARTDLMVRIGEPPPGTSIVVRLLALFGRRILLSRYLSAYRQQRPLDKEVMARWKIPIAAARLAEGIEEEVPALIRFLEQSRAASGQI
jgi:aminoglycoside phosphotransferase (APT) family kinase protein